MSYYPSWVYEAIIDADLPWDYSLKRKLNNFLEKYTFHDSQYVGLFYDLSYSNDITIVIQWDSVWLPDEIALGTSIIEDWPYLFINIKNVEDVSTWGYKDVENISRTIGKAEYTEIENKKILSISDVYDGNLQIIFTGDTYILAMDKNKNIINI